MQISLPQLRVPDFPLLLEMLVASGLFFVAGFLGASSNILGAVVFGLLAIPVARQFGIVVIDSLDLWMRRKF
ncbi:MAG: hypothetical protein K1X64_09595 [Myxococcaceae bacterium]|nr:hypothetical protein [Myxococcaceae bacterium]